MASGIFVPELRSLGEKIARKFHQTTNANSKIVIGISYRMLTEKARKDYNLPDLQGGIEITRVTPSSPAAYSGLQAGDVIRKVNGAILKSINDLRNRINSARIGQPLQFEVWHDGRPLDIKITAVNGFDFYGDSCDKGEAEGCLSLGDLYAELKQPLDNQRALRYYEKSCGASLAEACYKAAIAYRDAIGADKDTARAIALLKESCDGKFFDACSALGYYYQVDAGPDKNIIKASSFYKMACDGGSLVGCANLGIFFRDGIGMDNNDPMQAAKLFDRACDGGLASGCALLGELYQKGISGSRNPAKAANLYAQACSDGASVACQDLAVLLEVGDDGVPRDMVQAKNLYDKACGMDQGWSCFKLGLMFSQDGPNKDLSQSITYYQRGCRLGDPVACTSQGFMYEQGQVEGGDKVKAASLYEGACDNYALACDNRGRLAAEAGDMAKAFTFYGKACDKNLGQSCVDLAGLYLKEANGGGAKGAYVKAVEAIKKAAEAFKKQCDSGDYNGCFGLAAIYETGAGSFGRDPDKAAKLYEEACLKGHLQEACSKVGH